MALMPPDKLTTKGLERTEARGRVALFERVIAPSVLSIREPRNRKEVMANFIPSDAVLDVTDADVALPGIYQHRRHLTLTFPLLNRSRRVL